MGDYDQKSRRYAESDIGERDDMLRFTKRADYGLMAMHYIACHGDEGAVSAKRRLITSHNGPKGGYVLTRRPEAITVGQVVRALEGPIEIVSCMTDGDGCPQYSRCNLRRPVQKIQASISRLLDSMTLSELTSDGFVPVAELVTAT